MGEEDSRVAFAYIMMEMLPFSSLTTHLGPDDSDDGESNDYEEVMVLLWQSSKRLLRTSKLLILVIQTRADKRNLSPCRMRNRGHWQSCQLQTIQTSRHPDKSPQGPNKPRSVSSHLGSRVSLDVCVCAFALCATTLLLQMTIFEFREKKRFLDQFLLDVV